MKKTKNLKTIALSSISPDQNQPRKEFNPEKLGHLIKSIKKHGIMNPLIVEENGGNYLLVDGERRFKAAKELKLQEVPVIIVPRQSDTERLIAQFHLQEQNEGWSAIEKAMALNDLSEKLKVSMDEVAVIVGLNRKTVQDYLAFSRLIRKEDFKKSEISIVYAKHIIGLKKFVKETYEKQLKEEFPRALLGSLEGAVIARMKSGEIQSTSDVLKLRDVVKADPKSIENLIKDSKKTISSAFLSSKAEVARYYRQIKNNCSGLYRNLRFARKLKIEALFDKDNQSVNVLKMAYKELGNLIENIEI